MQQVVKSIQSRHKQQQIEKKIQGLKGKQKHNGQSRSLVTEDEEMGDRESALVSAGCMMKL
jgi:hypothetical protein